MGAPAVCPFGVGTASPVAATLPDANDEEIARREAICRGCYHFEGGAGCRECHCQEARKRPWIELVDCPRKRWAVPSPPPPPTVS